ncbi:MAG TPA: hypothetical protein VLF40_04955 [Candidatus Saccharimonadales bacterium]|nr:hypothetical protein [Candidatus Saccharimonadales bacterium]
MPSDYWELNYKELNKDTVKICYLCGRELSGEVSPDHVIPTGLFAKGSPKRPQLAVHHGCNNSKSFEDEKFIRQIQVMGSLNPDAEAEAIKLLHKAQAQKPNAYIIGKSHLLRDYKKAVGLLDKTSWGMQLVVDGDVKSALHFGKENAELVAAYMKRLCRGLYIRNVPDATPAIPRLRGVQYAAAKLAGNLEEFTTPVNTLMQQCGYVQQWGNRVRYAGNFLSSDISKGFVFVEFYGEVGYLAMFE